MKRLAVYIKCNGIVYPIALSLSLLLSACGGGGGGSDEPDITPLTKQLSGVVYKGPVQAALVQIYAADINGNRVSAVPLAESNTDSEGRWQATVPATTGTVRVESSGGFYFDESDNQTDPLARRQIILDNNDRLFAILPGDESFVVISSLSQALILAAQRANPTAPFLDRLATQRELYINAFGMDVLSQGPVDPLISSPPFTTGELRAAQILGGLANVMNRIAIAAGEPSVRIEIIEAVNADLSDCVLDGAVLGVPVQYLLDAVVLTLPNNIDFNTEILRYRNNNIDVFAASALPVITQSLCGQSDPSDDTTAPIFTVVPGNTTVNAEGPDGTPSDAPSVLAVLDDVAAEDDQDGVVVITNNAPATLGLGNNLIVLTARDAAGNARVVSVIITVEDLEAPMITAPNDLREIAVGATTPVPLGVPIVADNVSLLADLIVTNDAPASGAFAIGTTVVTWQVEDEVGLTAIDTQTIVIETAMPMIANVLPDVVADENVILSLSTAAGFSDADSTLVYALTGLPENSGLNFDVITGQLSGTPNRFDAFASPLSLSVSAMDEVNAVEQSFTLTINNINNAPDFIVNGDLDLTEDFMGTASITLEALPNTPDEQDEAVTYSLSPDPATILFADVSFNSANGTVSVTSLPNANGSVMLTLTADDGQVSNNVSSQTIELSVAAVNDPPQFELSGNLVLMENFAGVQAVSINLVNQPADEVGETIVYAITPATVSFANVAIDQGVPEIQVTSVANQFGSQLMIVTANDGQASSNQSFNLVVLEN